MSASIIASIVDPREIKRWDLQILLSVRVHPLTVHQFSVAKDGSTTSTSVEEETAKTCLMVNDNEVVTSSMVDKLDEASSHESSSCTTSTNLPTYDEPYNAFVEMHEELNKVAKINVSEENYSIA
ncbi:hypothetical protein Lal_00003762 [Lupinus albus]|nr:hypothetical protein Lal_00003762 [Lupinus albus]